MKESSIFKPNLIVLFVKEHGIHMTFNKNEFIYHSGDPTDYIYVIESGEVFVLRMQQDGAETVTHYLNDDCLFGAMTLFSGPKKHTTFAKSKTEVSLYKISKEEFENKILSNKKYTEEWIKWLEIDRMRHSTKLRDMIMYGKMGALASVLVRLSNTFGKEMSQGIVIDTRLTNQELGMLAGTSREVVNRYLKALEKDDVIEVNRKIITIKNINKLKMMINCENCDVNICQIY